MPQKLLHLIQWHAGIQQNRRDAGTKPVGSDAFGNPGSLRRLVHEALHIPGGVRLPPIALEHIPVVTAVQVSAPPAQCGVEAIDDTRITQMNWFSIARSGPLSLTRNTRRSGCASAVRGKTTGAWLPRDDQDRQNAQLQIPTATGFGVFQRS